MTSRSFPFFAVAAVVPQVITLSTSQSWKVPRNFHTITVTCNPGTSGTTGATGVTGATGYPGEDAGWHNPGPGLPGEPGYPGLPGGAGQPSTFQGQGSRSYTRNTLVANSQVPVVVGAGGAPGLGGAGGRPGGGGFGSSGALFGWDYSAGGLNEGGGDAPANADYGFWGNPGQWPLMANLGFYPADVILNDPNDPYQGASGKPNGFPPSNNPSDYFVIFSPGAGGPPGVASGAPGINGFPGNPGSVTITVA